MLGPLVKDDAEVLFFCWWLEVGGNCIKRRGVRIELRNRSTFEKGKFHEPSFYAWNRLGKEHVFTARG